MADRIAKANRQRLEKGAYLAQAARDVQSFKRRRGLLHRTTSQKAADATGSTRAHMYRNLKILKRESKLCAAAFFLTTAVPSSSQWANPEVLAALLQLVFKKQNGKRRNGRLTGSLEKLTGSLGRLNLA